MNLAKPERQLQQPSKKRPRAAMTNSSTGINDFMMIDLIQNLLSVHGDLSTKVYVDSNGRYHGRTGKEGRKCLVRGEINLSDNCFFTISDTGIINYYCFDGEAHPVCAGVPIGKLYNGGTKCQVLTSAGKPMTNTNGMPILLIRKNCSLVAPAASTDTKSDDQDLQEPESCLGRRSDTASSYGNSAEKENIQQLHHEIQLLRKKLLETETLNAKLQNDLLCKQIVKPLIYDSQPVRKPVPSNAGATNFGAGFEAIRQESDSTSSSFA